MAPTRHRTAAAEHVRAGAPMTAQERDALRTLIDQARRARIHAEDNKVPKRQRCSGCGRPHYVYTAGCTQCQDRQRSRRRREQEQA